MPIKFPSDEWVKAFKDRLNHSASYAEIARNWEGDLLFQIEQPNGPPLLLYLDLWRGQCRDAYQVPDSEPDKPAAFRLSAPLPNFVKILRGQLDPMQAMVTGKLKVQGSMVVMMKNIPTVLEFVRIAQQGETEFPEMK